jgi:isoleucyl-tRNA synthetase
VDEVRIACPHCGAPVERIQDVGNPWLDAGIVPFSTLHFREDPDYWADWFPADFITESFPGQFRNWFYSMLAMSTVLRREPPFLTIFGYALVFGEDGRPMHKSWGNAIDFDEAAERMGVDVMRWLFAKARPEENIPFGWRAAGEARRELLVHWNVYAFFTTYARLAGWTPGSAGTPVVADRAVADRAVADRPVLDRWILSRAAGTAAIVEDRLRDVDAVGATRALSEYMDGLSTWYLRLSRRRFSRSDDPTDQAAAFATLHEALTATVRMLAPILPFVTDAMYQNLVVAVDTDGKAPDSVHLTAYPTADLAAHRDTSLEATMAIAQRAVDLARTLRSSARLKTRQPLATAWIAVPDRGLAVDAELLAIVADEINVKDVQVITDESDLVERRVKPLLPKIGKRLGSAIPAVMAAARDGNVTFEADGSVTLGGVTLAPDEVEIQATPRPGTAVAHDDGLVVVIDTELTPALRAEGDARDIQRAIQDLRRDAGLDLDERVDLWVEGADASVEAQLPDVAADTLGDLGNGPIPADPTARGTVEVTSGEVRIALRRRTGGR